MAPAKLLMASLAERQAADSASASGNADGHDFVSGVGVLVRRSADAGTAQAFRSLVTRGAG